MFVNKLFKYLARAYLRKYKGYDEILSEHYIYVKTRMLADFQICISVPLKLGEKKKMAKNTKNDHS